MSGCKFGKNLLINGMIGGSFIYFSNLIHEFHSSFTNSGGIRKFTSTSHSLVSLKIIRLSLDGRWNSPSA